MKERPILFSAPMVRALLAGRKTQTRRIVKPLPSWQVHSVCNPSGAADPWAVWFHYPDTDRVGHLRECPYGKPGDRLWVRETWAVGTIYDGTKPSDLEPHGMKVAYAASGGVDGIALRPSIFMPRWASRITLEITEARVQRLNDICGCDAESEGVFSHIAEHSIDKVFRDARAFMAKTYFRELWDRINCEGSWAANPWVWALTFKRINI